MIFCVFCGRIRNKTKGKRTYFTWKRQELKDSYDANYEPYSYWATVKSRLVYHTGCLVAVGSASSEYDPESVKFISIIKSAYWDKNLQVKSRQAKKTKKRKWKESREKLNA